MNLQVCGRTGVDFGGQRPLGYDTQGGEICLAPTFFWQVMPTWYSKIKVYSKNPKLRTEIEPECGEDPSFWSSPEFGGNIPDRNRIIMFNQTSQKDFAPSEFA